MMKSWRSLIQKIEGWRYRLQHQRFFWWGKKLRPKNAGKSPHSYSYGQSGIKKHRTKLRDFIFMLVLSVIALTSVVGYQFYNQPQLTVGKISPLTIKAPYSAQFEDTKTTLEKRKEVQTGIIPILKQNGELTQEIKRKLKFHLQQIDELRSMAAPFPFAEQETLSLPSQRYIRFCPESEFKAVLASVTENYAAQTVKEGNSAELKNPLEKRPDFNLGLQTVAAELETYRGNTSENKFNTLIAQITLTRYRYSQAWQSIEQKKITRLDEKELIVLLDLTEKDWKATTKTILLTADRILTQGIPLGIPSNLLEEAVTAQLNPDIPEATERIAQNMLLGTLQPNLQEDKDATRNIAEKAAMAINSVLVDVEQGEVIVEQGERISQSNFVLLDGFKLSRRGINWEGLRLSAMVVGVIIGLFLIIQRRIYPAIRHRDYLLLCLLAISAPLLSIFDISYTSLPAIGLLVSSFYTPTLAICQVVLVTGLVAFSNQSLGSVYLLAGLVGGLIAAIFAGRLRYLARSDRQTGYCRRGIADSSIFNYQSNSQC